MLSSGIQFPPQSLMPEYRQMALPTPPPPAPKPGQLLNDQCSTSSSSNPTITPHENTHLGRYCGPPKHHKRDRSRGYCEFPPLTSLPPIIDPTLQVPPSPIGCTTPVTTATGMTGTGTVTVTARWHVMLGDLRPSSETHIFTTTCRKQTHTLQ